LRGGRASGERHGEEGEKEHQTAHATESTPPTVRALTGLEMARAPGR
jgi:hypothetical protein